MEQRLMRKAKGACKSKSGTRIAMIPERLQHERALVIAARALTPYSHDPISTHISTHMLHARVEDFKAGRGSRLVSKEN
jgi:hypothetical protein